MNPYIRRNN